MSNANERTPNLQFNLIPFDRRGYQDREYENWRALDALLTRFFAIGNYRGVWNNSTSYEIGDRVVDTETANVYENTIDHTSSTIPTTFAEERNTFPNRWTLFTQDISFRGEWTSNEDYAAGDFIYIGRTFSVATTSHRSSSTYQQDVDNGLWQELIDGDSIVADAVDARNKAEQWAQNPEDNPVELGEFSALHWAAKAEGFSIASSGFADDAEGYKDQVFNFVPDPGADEHFLKGNGNNAYELRTAEQFRSDIGTVIGTSPGNIMEVGAFGLGKTVVLPNETDLDTVQVTGFYDAGNAVNRPPGSQTFGYLLVHDYSGENHVKQEWTDLIGANTRKWIRRQVGGTWQPWVEVALYEEIDGAPRQNHPNMPYVDGVPIIGEGSNSDGYFVEFANGFILARREESIDISVTNHTIQFPVDINNPGGSVLVAEEELTGSGFTDKRDYYASAGIGIGGSSGWRIRPSETASGQMTIRCFAFGEAV